MWWRVVFVIALLMAAAAVGLVRRARSGTFRQPASAHPRPDTDPTAAASADPTGEVARPRTRYRPTLSATQLRHPLGERATIVQFSSAFCAPCRAARVLLGDVAATVPGVAHVEVDAESHLELVRALDIRSTPTILVLDRTGLEAARATGLPKRADVLTALVVAFERPN